MPHSALEVRPIGVLRVDGDGVRVELDPRLAPALKGLEHYSHLHVLWWFSGRDNAADRARLEVNPPHRGTPGPMGVFATRSPCRPNPIAVSTARILEVDEARAVVRLDWTDARDGTPVLDLKPYSPGLDRVEDCAEPAWHEDWPKSYEEARASGEN